MFWFFGSIVFGNIIKKSVSLKIYLFIYVYNTHIFFFFYSSIMYYYISVFEPFSLSRPPILLPLNLFRLDNVM